MSCKFDEKILHLYADNELGEHIREKLEEHLAYCGECRRVVESIRALKSELAAACSAVKAPVYLRDMISNSLEPAGISNPAKLNLKEKLSLIALNFHNSRRWAWGFVIAIILIFILLPGKHGLQSIAGKLAKEHMNSLSYVESGLLQTNEAAEVIDFLKQELGLSPDIPQYIQDKFKLEGVRLLKINDNPVAHVRYSDGQDGCSMFILNSLFLEEDYTELYIASGIEFKACNCGDCNLICWENNKNCYILCGNCCFKDLVKMAVSFI
jgi:hypothetical protein